MGREIAGLGTMGSCGGEGAAASSCINVHRCYCHRWGNLSLMAYAVVGRRCACRKLLENCFNVVSGKNVGTIRVEPARACVGRL
jgi:hypothetical protein